MINEIYTQHFVYQRIHALGGKALHLDEHLRIASHAFEHIYGFDPMLDEHAIASRISEALRAVRIPARAGAIVMLRLAPQGTEIEFERRLLEAGYTHSPLRPAAVTFEYKIPFGAFPTGFQLSARALFDSLALSRHGAVRSVRREGNWLLSCGDTPLFALRDRTLITPPLTEGAIDSVERTLVMDAATSLRLNVRQEPIPHSELKGFDELFFADAAGITSLAECDGAKFMSLTAPRIAEAMKSM